MSTRSVFSSGSQAGHSFVRGFTIIELLVVVAIIGMLSAIILTSMSTARARGRQGAALQAMKSVHDIAMVCVSTNPGTYTFCLPGQNTGGCSASPIGDSNTGGGGILCASNPNGRYVSLPPGYVYCDGSGGSQTTTNCGNDTSSLPASQSTYFNIKAENNLDGYLITCVEQGCSVAADSD